MHGVTVRTNARHARQLAAILSPTRSFVAVDRGVYFLEASGEVQALRDYDYIVSQRLVSADAVRLIDGDL